MQNKKLNILCKQTRIETYQLTHTHKYSLKWMYWLVYAGKAGTLDDWMCMNTCCLSLRWISLDVVTRALREQRRSTEFYFPPICCRYWFRVHIIIIIIIINDVDRYKSMQFSKWGSLKLHMLHSPSTADITRSVCVCVSGCLSVCSRVPVPVKCTMCPCMVGPISLQVMQTMRWLPANIVVERVARWLCAARVHHVYARTLIFHLIDDNLCEN